MLSLLGSIQNFLNQRGSRISSFDANTPHSLDHVNLHQMKNYCKITKEFAFAGVLDFVFMFFLSSKEDMQ